MKKILFGIISVLVIASSLSSCTVEKRVHQDGYHISWKHRHAAPADNASEIALHEEVVIPETPALTREKLNVHSEESISASNSENLVIQPQRRIILLAKKDTVIPDQPKTQEEYFSNTYTPPARPDELQDIKLANWALGLGIGAVSAPVWGLVLFFILAALLSASSSSYSIWAAFGFAFLLGGALFITMEILAIVFAIRFLKLHAKDPNYTKYRKRAITALILAGIYPALLLLNIILALAAI
jgi:hypothetical protein